jgi:hypothetical protein
MSDHLSYQANPQTRGTVGIQFFEADNVVPPPGTQATPRPAGRPRELPPTDLSPAPVLFERESAAGDNDATALRRPDGQKSAQP